MTKNNTKRKPSKQTRLATPELLVSLRGIHGLGSMIERIGGPNHAFTSRVLSRQKPPTQRWLAAVALAMDKIGKNAILEAIELFRIDTGLSRKP